MARRDPLAIEELLVDQRFQCDVFATGDATQTRAQDASALVVVVARVVPVDRRHYADVGIEQLGDLFVAVAHAGVVLASDLAVHVDADEDRLFGLLRKLDRIGPSALPADLHRLGPIGGRRRVPHLLWDEALRLRDTFLSKRTGQQRNQN